MKNRFLTPALRTGARFLLLAAALCLVLAPAAQAQTAGGTQIENRATATYSDGTDSYSTVSNTVTVTVANVSGLVITPDAGSVPTVVAGQTGVDFNFTVSNASNFATQVRFLASGGSLVTSGPVTVTAAVIDPNGDGIGGGDDIDILGNGSNVLYPSSAPYLAAGASFAVVVRASVNAGAANGAGISVQLGAPPAPAVSPYDNVVVAAGDLATAKVRTSTPVAVTAPVNGESEARGDISTTVENDAQLQVRLSVPAGPVALGSNITYTLELENTGARPADPQTLAGAPGGSGTGVFVVVPIPTGTTFNSFSALPGGVTVLYSTSALGADPAGEPPASGPRSAAAVWTTTAPALLSDVRRVAFNATGGAALANGATVTGLGVVLTVQTGINASVPVYGIAEAFAVNSVAAPLTDQSDYTTAEVSNKGDGNANFNEPRRGTSDVLSATKGWQQPTSLLAVGNVLIGPSGAPSAVGPTDVNDDYTNKSVAPAVISGVAPGGAVGVFTVNFVNTVENTGNANDTYTISAPSAAAGLTVEVSTDGGTTYTTVSGGGSTSLAVGFGATANINVRVTSVAGKTVLTGFDSVLEARSQTTNTNYNQTIDRVYTGFLSLVKSPATVINATGVGAATDAVPGAEIEYEIVYSNVTTAAGTGNVNLTASSVVITEDGSAAPNNWAATTTQVVGSATDTTPGSVIAGDALGSNLLTVTVGTIAPGQSGTFKFRRLIN